ncbi:hypothetical protein Hanom_Chr07g00627351 [Helianthus anomalus]
MHSSYNPKHQHPIPKPKHCIIQETIYPYYLKLLRSRTDLSLFLACFLRKQSGMNVGKNTTICNSHRSQQFTQLFIVPHR